MVQIFYFILDYLSSHNLKRIKGTNTSRHLSKWSDTCSVFTASSCYLPSIPTMKELERVQGWETMDLMLLTHIMNTFAIINRIHKHAFISMLIFRLLSFLLTPRRKKKRKNVHFAACFSLLCDNSHIEEENLFIFSSQSWRVLLPSNFPPHNKKSGDYFSTQDKITDLSFNLDSVVRWFFVLSTNALRQSEGGNGWIFCLI